MSWEDILKIDPERMMEREPDRKPVRGLEAPDSKVIDEQTVAEMDVTGNCCEAARNAAVTVANSFLDHPLKNSKNSSVIDNLDGVNVPSTSNT